MHHLGVKNRRRRIYTCRENSRCRRLQESKLRNNGSLSDEKRLKIVRELYTKQQSKRRPRKGNLNRQQTLKTTKEKNWQTDKRAKLEHPKPGKEIDSGHQIG